MRLIVEVARAVKHVTINRTVQIVFIAEQLDVLRHPARYGITLYLLAKALARKELTVVAERYLLHADLRSAPAVQRAVVGQRLRSHHRNQRPAEHHHHVCAFQLLFPDPLEDGRESGVRFADVLELVYDDDLLFAAPIINDGLEDDIPVLGVNLPKQVVPRKVSRPFLECGAVYCFRFFASQEEQGLAVLYELGQQSGLANAAAAVKHNQRAAFPAILALERGKLFFSIDEPLHLCPSYYYACDYYTSEHNNRRHNQETEMLRRLDTG